MTDKTNTNPELVINTIETTTENPDTNGERAVQQVTDFVETIPDDKKAIVTEKVNNYNPKGWGDLLEFMKEFFQDIQLNVDEGNEEEASDEITDENESDNEEDVPELDSKKEMNDPNSFIEKLKGHFHWPVIGRISSHFGKRKAPKKGASTHHGGIDIAAPAGTLINPTQSGTISKIGYDSKSGNYIKINHPDGTQSVYCHLQSRPSLKAGQDVSINTPIGKVGSTGVSTGPHLHFEIRYNEQKINPEELLA